MPVNTTIAQDVWDRYQYLRDNGHLDYIKKANKCENFFEGLQWESSDLALLRAYKRPALTINKIIATLSNVMGEQIFNRTEIAFRPRNEGATDEVADALTKVYMQISDNNQLAWVRSDVFADGVISSRGFYDVRLDFSDSLKGEVRIEQLNPKNVLVDADADKYDPDEWGDVITTKWLSPDQVALLYSEEDAKYLQGRQESFSVYGNDAIDRERDRFGNSRAVSYGSTDDLQRGMVRGIRVLERQWRKLDRVLHFVDIETGDMRPVPDSWDRNAVGQHLAQNPNLAVTKKLIQRVRWTVVADNVVLHDDWSPYKHFTVVPYFPHFRRGRTVGLVENLLGPQELLNKIRSQELHIVNTTANSGWKVKSGALRNMTIGELENIGAKTGLVLELDEMDSAEKIQPNQVPTGLDRISYKAEEDIKNISGVSDYMTGNPREDVSAKAVKANQARGSGNLAKVMDNLNRTDFILARNILDLVQEYYTEQRLLKINKGDMTRFTEDLVVNAPTAEGRILNDLTLGEYAVVVSNQPERDTFEDTQFEQAVLLRTEVGVQIPDQFIIGASKLRDKAKIIEAISPDNQSPEAQYEKDLALRSKKLEVDKLAAETMSKTAAAKLAEAKAVQALKDAQSGNGEDEIAVKLRELEQEHELKMIELEQKMQLEREKNEADIQLAREKAAAELEIKRMLAVEEAKVKRAQAVHTAAMAKQTANNPNNGAPGNGNAGSTPAA